MEKCPLCKAPTNWRDLLEQHDADAAWRPWKRRQYQTIGFALQEAVAAGAEYERRRPARQASIEADVAVPGAQALITGAAGGLCSGVLGAAFGAARPLLIGVGLGAATLGLSWLILLADHRSLLWEVESVIGADLDGDGDVGAPSPSRDLRIELQERLGRNQHRMLFIDLPCSETQLHDLARGLLAGRSTGESAWTGSGNPFSRSEFGAVRDELIERGLAYWRDPDHHAQGWELTAAGRRMMRKVADRPTPAQSGRTRA